MNLTKKLLIQFEGNERTRWLVPDSNLAEVLRAVCGSVAIAHTSGAVPKVTVTLEEQPEQKGQ